MSEFVALFRGINVGKAKRIAMADLRALLQGLGYDNVRTLLNSGNAIFGSKEASPATLAKLIQSGVKKSLGIDTFVIVKSAQEMDAIVAGNALAAKCTDPSKLLVAFMSDAGPLSTLTALAKEDWGAETLHVGRHAAYLWCADGILQSKLAVTLLRDLEGAGTTRNWGTTLKLHALLR